MEFLLAVLTMPDGFAGEADCLEALLEAGVERLHLRKPAMRETEVEALLGRLASRWADRLVVHGPRCSELARRYGIGRVHGAVAYADGSGNSGGGPAVKDAAVLVGLSGRQGLAVSTSVHSWGELAALPRGLAYAFLSPLFDSISKPGYGANEGLLQRPEGGLPCRPVGLGGVSAETVGELVRYGWTGAAVLGGIWGDREKGDNLWRPQPDIVRERYKRIKESINGAADRIGSGGV